MIDDGFRILDIHRRSSEGHLDDVLAEFDHLESVQEDPIRTVNAALEIAEFFYCGGKYAKVIEYCDRADQLLDNAADPLCRSRLIFRRASALFDVPLDAIQLAECGDVIASAGLFSEASSAYQLAADAFASAGDLAQARRVFGMAIGSGMLAGSSIAVASLLRQLAQCEIQYGDLNKSLLMSRTAIAQLKNEWKLFASPVEARCWDTFADACVALGDFDGARDAYRQAIDIETRLERHGAAEKIARKVRDLPP